MNHTFAIKPEGFELDGKPMRIISGAIHYFRVPREYWEDRLLKLKACGFNTVETYIAWNAHQPTEDEFIYDGMLDVCEFLRTAQRLGLWAIVRPGPYICSEWEFGALPWWLLKKPGIRLRCLNAPYMEAVDRFFDDLLPRLAPLQLTRGGNILMMQVENEYGSYGDDKPYLTALAEGMRRRGIEVPLFTSDGATDFMLTGGTLPGIHKTANFGSRAGEQFDKLREFQPDGPLMCCEFWNGWFDHWTEKHHTREPQEAADALRDIIGEGNVDGHSQPDRILRALAYYGIYDNRVVLWGTGSPLREFLWSEDMADASVHVLLRVDFSDIIGIDRYSSVFYGAKTDGRVDRNNSEGRGGAIPELGEIRNCHINVGTGKELTIRQLAHLVAEAVGFEGTIDFDASRPDGTMRKLIDVTKLHSLGWTHKVEIEDGVRRLFDWYRESLS